MVQKPVLPSGEGCPVILWEGSFLRQAHLVSAAQPPFTMCFRVKFYPADPAALKEEITR